MNSKESKKNLILGTAGHVDHGKTTLIKAMTGVNTDRLKEEQERGLTIDLGFASLALPSGQQIGIVDVPGHEKFLKNMLAGASGVDIALLVVAADEGVMPQTREHLEILELLETRLGLVALTKCDMVEEDWLDIVQEDLEEYLKDTIFKNSKIIRVSAATGEGIADLIKEIDSLADQALQRYAQGPFRLPIDRVFTMTGFGTVVTGTLASGTIRIGDNVRILPQELDSRVRQIQVHGKKQEEAYAGSRVAVNLVGVEVSDIERGSVVLPPGYLEATSILNANVSVLKDSPHPLKSRMRVRLHIGTVEAIGRVKVLALSKGGTGHDVPSNLCNLSSNLSDITSNLTSHLRHHPADEIAPGETGFIQLRLESKIVAARGDRFVLRFYSPARVMGGGVILEPNAIKHRRADKDLVARLERIIKGDPADIIEDLLASSEAGLIRKDIIQRAGVNEQDVDSALKQLMDSDNVVELPGRFAHKSVYDMLSVRIKVVLADYHKANPIKPGMPIQELKTAIGPKMEQKGFQALISSFAARGEIKTWESLASLPDHVPTLTSNQQELLSKIEVVYREAGNNPPLLSDIEKQYGTESREIMALLISRGTLVKIDTDILFHISAIENAETALRKYLQENSQITVAQFRDLVGSSRKYVVPLLEFFDYKHVTRRIGDQRVAG